MAPDAPDDSDDSARQLLRAHGLQVTAQRLAVLRVVATHPHATAEEIERLVRADLGSISRQAVYDVLAALSDNGLLRRIEPAASPARYETRVGDNHHHLICRACGQVTDVDCAIGERPCLTPVDAAGYEIDEAEVIYWGRCPACARSVMTRSDTGPAKRRTNRTTPSPP